MLCDLMLQVAVAYSDMLLAAFATCMHCHWLCLGLVLSCVHCCVTEKHDMHEMEAIALNI